MSRDGRRHPKQRMQAVSARDGRLAGLGGCRGGCRQHCTLQYQRCSVHSPDGSACLAASLQQSTARSCRCAAGQRAQLTAATHPILLEQLAVGPLLEAKAAAQALEDGLCGTEGKKAGWGRIRLRKAGRSRTQGWCAVCVKRPFEPPTILRRNPLHSGSKAGLLTRPTPNDSAAF